MASIQRIFPQTTVNALSFVRKPRGALGQWDQVNAVYSRTGARYMGPSRGATQQGAVPQFSAVPGGATQALMLVQFVSDPLRSVLIAAQDWNVGYALRLANAGATYQWQGNAALFVLNALTGERRATVFDVTAIGSGARTTTAEFACLATIAGESVQVRAGDCLCLELGISIANSAAALAPQVTLFAEGVTPITSDNVAISSALTTLELPQDLLLTLPQAGESATASVTTADAIRIIKEAWPPRSDSLYDWNDPDALVAKIFDALGIVFKLYGFDQSDRVFREVNPLTTVELLPAWEALLGISLSDTALRVRSADQRRQTVLARLREMGPLTVHNLAAIFATMAGYVAPQRPEVIEMGEAAMRPANLYTDTLGGAIPTGTTFDATNLIRHTPTLLDGGIVWDAGVRVTLNLSAMSSDALHIRLTGPDFTTADWLGGPNLTTAVTLRSAAHAGRPIHGTWKLQIWRTVGSPAVTLNSWSLYTLGKRWGGRSGVKHIWSVYLDPAHQTVDARDIGTTLDRITQSYCEGFCIYDKTSIPGINTHRAGRFIPGP